MLPTARIEMRQGTEHKLGSSPMMRAPIDKQRSFFGMEYFVRVAVRRPDRDFLTDMFKPEATL